MIINNLDLKDHLSILINTENFNYNKYNEYLFVQFLFFVEKFKNEVGFKF